MPNVAFQFRAGYIFIILLTFFVIVSYCSKITESAEPISDTDRKKMLLWAKILGGVGALMIVSAAIVTIYGAMNPNADANSNFMAYLNDIGFQAFFFFGVLVGQSAIWLYSNSKDGVKDVKALPVNLNLFATTRSYTYGTIGICVLVFLLYALLW
jgi:SSS family solute:Na+ symporter